MSRYYIGSHVFPDVLLNDIAGPDGDPLLLSLKLSVDVLVSGLPPSEYEFIPQPNHDELFN
jgi:hypothetical protein